MGNRLYQTPFRRWSEGRKNAHIERFSSAKSDFLSDDNVNDVINFAVNHPELNLPNLKNGDKYGKRVSNTLMDIHVPFEGNGFLFELEPTSHTLVTDTIYIDGNEIIFRLRDDEFLEKNLESMIKTIQNNLDNLGRDISQFRLSVNQAIMAAAAARKAELNAVAARDRSRSFPIR